MSPPDDDAIEGHLHEVGNRALASATLYTLVLGLLCAAGLAGYLLVGGPRPLVVPMIGSLWGAISSGLLAWLAHRRRLTGVAATASFALYASLPTFVFLASHALLPGGAATFMTGPMVLLYAVLITLSGALMRPRLPLFVGLFTATSLLGCFALARPVLLTVRAADPTLQAEFADPFIWINKAVMLVFAGLVTSALTVIARRLALAVREEAGERDRIRRVFGQYVSDEVAAHVLSGDAPLGERKPVVVLFADIRGFTTMSENTDPGELVKHLNTYFDAMVTAIEREGGVIDKFIGDAIMAVFDGVLPLERPEDAALAAATAMQRALVELNTTWKAEGHAPWRIGIGLHRGEVISGSIGSATRRDFTVIGDAVNTASRLEGLTKTYDRAVLLSGDVRDRLRDPSSVDDLGEIAIRGRSGTVRVFGSPST